MAPTKSFRDLQAQWYAKLKDSEFSDIESTKHDSRPLKEWHSHKFSNEKFQIIRATRSQYQEQIDNFINHPTFLHACQYAASHGNSKFTVEEVQLIWELYAEGLTRRKIAARLRRVKSRIDDIIYRLTEWMKYL